MNKVYRLVWSAVIGAWVCVAETARARGKTRGAVVRAALLPLFVLGGAGPALAGAPPPNTLPTGGQVVAGQASIQQNTPGAPATLTIQQGTQRAAIDWQSFNIGAAASVRFIQPSSQSVTLNRVLDGNPTQIFGKLSANGQVYLTNPSGVYFAPSASVEVGGLVATTHSLSNADFLAGLDSFDRLGSTGKVLNLGRLEAAPGGYIALLAPEVRNEGVIVANAGTVALAAGENITLDFGPDAHLAGISVTPAQIRTLVENRRAIVTEGGQIILAARSAEGLMGNYVLTGQTTSSASITPKGLSVIANDATKIANGLPYSGGNGVTYVGFVPGEDASVLGGALSYSGTAQGALTQGLYTITPEGLSSGNYLISFVDGHLTITPPNNILPPLLGTSAGGSARFSAVAGGTLGLAPASGSRITVELTRLPDNTIDGFVSIKVPYDLATNGVGFNITLPGDVLGSEQDLSTAQASLLDGSPLPAWMHFAAADHSLSAAAVPDASFPMQMVLTGKGGRTVVVVTELPRP